MDFNKLVNTLRDIEPVNVFDANGASKKALTESAAPAAPKVELSAEAQMRVLAGVSTILAESTLVMEKAKSKSQQQAAGAALAAKRGEGKAKGASKEMSKMSTKELEKIASTKHKGLPKKVKESEALDTEEELDEVFDAEAKVGDKKKTSTGVATKTATGLKHEKTYGKDADDSDDEDKKPAKKKVKEGKKPDFLDVDKDGDKKEPFKKAVADKKKKPVKESVEQKLSFKDCIKLVRESGGQQQIDPLDKELFAWAQRVAQAKFTESVKQDAFAGVTYERFGGRFALYDVLSESKK